MVRADLAKHFLGRWAEGEGYPTRWLLYADYGIIITVFRGIVRSPEVRSAVTGSQRVTAENQLLPSAVRFGPVRSTRPTGGPRRRRRRVCLFFCDAKRSTIWSSETDRLPLSFGRKRVTLGEERVPASASASASKSRGRSCTVCPIVVFDFSRNANG